MNLGTSYLGAHVRLLSETRAGLVPLDEFDVQTKGGKVLPPIGLVGLAAHAASEPRETLSADAKKLAAQIVKRVANTMKAQTNAMAATNGGGWSGYCRYIQDRTGTRVYEQSLKVPSSPNAEIHD